MINENLKTEDNRVLIYESPVKLTQIASVKIAIALWYHEDIRRNVDDRPDGYWSDFEYFNLDDSRRCYDTDDSRSRFRSLSSLKWSVSELSNQLPIPSAVAKIICDYISPIKRQIDKWVTYHQRRIFFSVAKSDCYQYVDEIIWKCSGNVNYIETAKNLLSSPRLSNVEKYRIICVYCLKDEINNVLPFMFSNKYTEHVSFLGHPLIYYWNCYVKHELDKIDLGGLNSVDSRMITMKNVDNKWAMEYFWSRLSEEDKVEVVIRLIRDNGAKYQTFLLNQLTEVQQYHVFTEMAVSIVKNYIFESSIMAERALSAWTRISNYISKEQFVDIVESLFDRIRQWHYTVSYSTELNYIIPVIINIWNNVPLDFKHYALTDKNGILVNNTIEFVRRNSHFELLTEMLRDASVDIKNNVVHFDTCLGLCEQLIMTREIVLLDRFLKICFSKYEDLIDYKKQIMYRERVKQYFGCQFSTVDVLELNCRLAECLPDASFVAEYKAHVFMFCGGLSDQCYGLRKIKADSEESKCKFLTDVLSGGNAADKKKAIMSEKGRQLCVWMLEYSHQALFNHFVDLCLFGAEAITFKKEVIVNNSVIRVLLKLVVKEKWAELDKFLALCLSDPLDVAECKARILLSNEGMTLCMENVHLGGCVVHHTTKLDPEKNFKLFTKMLTNANESITQGMVYSDHCRRFCERLAHRGYLRMLDSFLVLCLSDDDATAFKKQLIDVYAFYECACMLLRDDKFQELDDFVTHYLPDEDKRTQYLCNFPINKFSTSLNSNNYIIFNTFIDKVSPNPDIARNIKNKMLLHKSSANGFHKWIKSNGFDKVEDCVTVFLQSESDIMVVKGKIFKYFKGKEATNFSILDEVQYKSLLLWCLNDEQKILDYKNSVDVENIFMKLLHRAIFVKYDNKAENCKLRKYKNGQLLELNRFLHWFFDSNEAVKNFKIEHSHEYHRIENVCNSKGNIAEKLLKKLKSWWFRDEM